MSDMACSCGCSPCNCGFAAPPGCLGDSVPLRPSFFSGQLVTSEDLNAVVGYFRAREAMLARLVGGWGVLGGMRLLATSGSPSFQFFQRGGVDPPASEACTPTLLPNPQLVPGSVIQLSAGASVDAKGQFLTLTAPMLLDIDRLAQDQGADYQSRSQQEWMGGAFGLGSQGGPVTDTTIVAAPFWVVAEYDEVPVRPMPSFTADECDTGPGCDFSRRREQVRISLRRDLPLLYFLDGCLEGGPSPPCFDQFLTILRDELFVLTEVGTFFGFGDDFSDRVTAFIEGRLNPRLGAADALVADFDDIGFKQIPQLVEYLNNIAITSCCLQPGVVLGRVLLAIDIPQVMKNVVGESERYVLIDDAFPYRRPIPNRGIAESFLKILDGFLSSVRTNRPVF